MKKYFLILLETIICLSCSAYSFTDYDSTKGFNTTITIHYNNESDKEYTIFQQYDLYSLKEFGIVEPPAHIIESEKLKTIIRLNLDKPSLLLFGFTEFYIEPNNNLDIDYSIIKHTKTEFKDSIKINHVAFFDDTDLVK